MFKNAYQSGSYLEVFHTKIDKEKDKSYEKLYRVSNPNELVKVFDKSTKGYIFELNGGTKSTLHFPYADKQELGLIQPFLVLQMFLPQGAPFSIEINLTDTAKNKRRLHFSTGIRQMEKNYFHVKIPIDSIKRGVWLNLSFDLIGFFELFKGQTFRSLDAFSIGGVCKIRRIYTMKTPLIDFSSEDESSLQSEAKMVPKTQNFPPSVVYENQLITPALVCAPQNNILSVEVSNSVQKPTTRVASAIPNSKKNTNINVKNSSNLQEKDKETLKSPFTNKKVLNSTEKTQTRKPKIGQVSASISISGKNDPSNKENRKEDNLSVSYTKPSAKATLQQKLKQKGEEKGPQNQVFAKAEKSQILSSDTTKSDRNEDESLKSIFQQRSKRDFTNPFLDVATLASDAKFVRYEEQETQKYSFNNSEDEEEKLNNQKQSTSVIEDEDSFVKAENAANHPESDSSSFEDHLKEQHEDHEPKILNPWVKSSGELSLRAKKDQSYIEHINESNATTEPTYNTVNELNSYEIKSSERTTDNLRQQAAETQIKQDIVAEEYLKNSPHEKASRNLSTQNVLTCNDDLQVESYKDLHLYPTETIKEDQETMKKKADDQRWGRFDWEYKENQDEDHEEVESIEENLAYDVDEEIATRWKPQQLDSTRKTASYNPQTKLDNKDDSKTVSNQQKEMKEKNLWQTQRRSLSEFDTPLGGIRKGSDSLAVLETNAEEFEDSLDVLVMERAKQAAATAVRDANIMNNNSKFGSLNRIENQVNDTKQKTRPYSPPFTHKNVPEAQISKKRDSIDEVNYGSKVDDELGGIESEKENVNNEIEVVYDPVWKCYYHPRTNSYYEMK